MKHVPVGPVGEPITGVMSKDARDRLRNRRKARDKARREGRTAKPLRVTSVFQ